MATILELFSLTPNELFFELFLPFALTLVIFFAVLQMVRLFNRRINLIISTIVTIMIATTPLFAQMAVWISQFGSYTAMIAFIGLFVLGIGAWVFRKGGEYVGDAIEAEMNLKKLYKKRAKLLDEIERTSSDTKRAAKYDQLEDYDKAIRTNRTRVKHKSYPR